MNIAAIIVGIDGFERYTLPLIDSIRRWEPDCNIVIVDNASNPPYPSEMADDNLTFAYTGRCSYSAAINWGKNVVKTIMGGDADWYIVLSNDVLCAGPFAHLLAPLAPCVAGPQLWHEHGLDWIVGWAVFAHREVWDAVGGWDENFIMSSWEDVDFSVSAVEHGYSLLHMPALPFVHLDQQQRFGLPGYEGSEQHNINYFMRKHVTKQVTA